MRTIPSMLLLAPLLLPAAAQADTYKCVINGETIYSQVKCGDKAETVKAQDALSGVGQPMSTAGRGPTNTPQPQNNANTRPASAPPATHSGDTPGVEETQSACQARLAAYRESQACFGRYRINANVMDPKAYKNCKVVPEPTDCLAGGSQ